MKTKCGMPEFITDKVAPEEGVCELSLDNGVVDLISATFLGTAAGDLDDGVLYRTDYVSQHISESAADIVTGPVDGTIFPPDVVGTPPDDGSKAASFSYSGDYPNGTSPYEKKRMITLCPPSVFTGKMRVYVQALYGRHDLAPFFKLPDSILTSQPSIIYDRSKVFGDELGLSSSAILFDVNCGIFTDPDTCKHYLVSIRGSTAYVYRMLASSCADGLRSQLVDTSVPLGTKVRVETYILSESYPDVSGGPVATLDVPVISGWSLGYGWHFDYSGSKADIVEGSYSGVDNISTHHRLFISFDRTANYWSLSPVVVEGPTQWKNARDRHVIASPAWGYGGLVKLGVADASAPFGDAPFYVFYTRKEFSDSASGALSLTMQSDIQVCRYLEFESSESTGGSRSPWYINANTFYTYGSDGFDYSVYAAYSATNALFSCGSASVSAGDYTRFDYGTRGSSPTVGEYVSIGVEEVASDGLPQVVDTGQPGNVPTATIDDPVFGTIQIGNGTVGQAGSEYETTEITIPEGHRAGFGGLYGYCTYENYVTTVTANAYVLSVIPYYDSEALYLYRQEVLSPYETGYTADCSGTFWRATIDADSGGTAILNYYGICGQRTPGAFVPYARSPTPTSTQESALVCAAGTVADPSVPGIGGFFAVSEFVSQKYSTYTSAYGKAVVAPENDVLEGTSTPSDIHAFVGWA